MGGYVLIKNGERLANHSTRLACGVEAVERGLASWSSRTGVCLDNGVEIIPLADWMARKEREEDTTNG